VRGGCPPTTPSFTLVRGCNRIGAGLVRRAKWTIPPRQGRKGPHPRARAVAPVVGPAGDDLNKMIATPARLVRRGRCGRNLHFIALLGRSRGERTHEVVAIRLVDPREYELPTQGLWSAGRETGAVDSSMRVIPVRRRPSGRGEEQGRAHPPCRHGAGVDLHVCQKRTICSARFVRMAGTSGRRRR